MTHPRLSPKHLALAVGVSACLACLGAHAQNAPAADAPGGAHGGQAMPAVADAPGGAGMAAAAAQEGPAEPTGALPDDGRRIEWLEKTRYGTWRASYWLASKVDGWFGNKPFEPQGRVAGQLRITPLWQQHDGLKTTVRFRLRADLPNLQNKAYAFIGQDNRNEVVADVPDGFTREQRLLRRADTRRDQSFFAGLGYAASDDLDFRVGFRGGLKPYAQVRYSRQWPLSPRDVLRFRESLFWSSRDSVGSTTFFEYEHAYARDLAFRWSTVGTVTRRSEGLEWQSAVGLFKELPRLRSASVEALVEGKTDSVDISNYGVRISWRQPIYRDWLFGKVTLGHFWPREKAENERVRSWAVGVGVAMDF